MRNGQRARRSGLVHPFGAFVLLALALGATTAQGASELPDPYACKTVEGRCAGGDGRYPVQYVSLHDGATDFYFVRFPDSYDKDRAYPLLMHFHPYCAGISTIADLRMLRQVSNDNNVIFLGHWQRGGEDATCGASYLGDGKAESPQAAQAAREDMRELLNELTAHFKISYIITAGASMGGYTALRMTTLFPDKVHVSLTSVAAMFEQHNLFPEPTLILQAAQDGVYDDKLLYAVVGSEDFSIKAHRRLDSILQGKTHWSYHEIAGQGHISVFSDDWNVARGHCKDPNLPDSHCWYISTPDTPLLWQEVRLWEEAHPAVACGTLEPDCGWVEPATPAARYLTTELAAVGGRSWPRPTPWCGSSSSDSGVRRREAGVAKDLGVVTDLEAPALAEAGPEQGVGARTPPSSSCVLNNSDTDAAGLGTALLLVALFWLWRRFRRQRRDGAEGQGLR